MYQLSDGTSVEEHTGALDPYRDVLKGQLERVHAIVVDPRNPRLLKELLHLKFLGNVKLSRGTERFLWAKFQTRLAWHLQGKINPRKKKRKKKKGILTKTLEKQGKIRKKNES